MPLRPPALPRRIYQGKRKEMVRQLDALRLSEAIKAEARNAEMRGDTELMDKCIAALTIDWEGLALIAERAENRKFGDDSDIDPSRD